MISATTISPLNRRIVDDGGGFDPIASAFIAAAGITGATQQAACNILALALRGSGTTNGTNFISGNLLYYFYSNTPIDDSTFSLNSCKFNFLNPLDTDAAFRITWANDPIATVNGVSQNGSVNAYGNTHFNENNETVLGSVGYSWGLKNFVNVSNNDYAFGASTSGDLLGPRYRETTNYIRYYHGNVYVQQSFDAISRNSLNRVATNNLLLYRNGSYIANNINIVSQKANESMYLLSRNSLGSPTSFTNATIQYMVSHKGLNADQVKDLDDAIVLYLTALGTL